MKLFIRAPLLLPEIPVRVKLSEPGLAEPPPDIAIQEWFLDTGFSGEAFAWREHLEAAHLDPEQNLFPGSVIVKSLLTVSSAGDGGADSGALELPIRCADLWLEPSVQGRSDFFCLPLKQGIAFRDESIPPGQRAAARPLIGMRLLLRARLKIELNLLTRTVSIWTPTDRELPS